MATATTTNAPETTNAPSGQRLNVWFVDVGQADCILLSDGETAVLVDAGNNGDGDEVAAFIANAGVERLTYAIGTHPHEDHIGGLDQVLSQVPTNAVLLPAKESDTQTYQDVLAAIEDAGAERVTAQPGATYDFGFYSMTVLGPVKTYDDMNNNSVVVRVDCGETSFLLTGDIEEQAEHDILSMGYDVECTVLKAPHHGSETSSSYVFLRAAYPEMVVIQCGRDNSYGHPHEDPLSRYRDIGATVYRTDTMGTIHLTSDGHSVSADAQGIASPVTRARWAGWSVRRTRRPIQHAGQSARRTGRPIRRTGRPIRHTG
jgi:competence protein ComEC